METTPFKPKIEMALFIAMMLCAAALRVWGLIGAPPGYSDDELAVLRITERVRAGQITVFYDVGDPTGSREGLYYPLLSIFTGAGGGGLFATRLLTVLVHLLTLAYLYAFTRQAFGQLEALFALGALTVSYWPVFTARMVSREALMPLFAAAAAYHILRGVTWLPVVQGDQIPALHMAVGGLMMGLALYTYWTGLVLLAVFLLFGLYLGFRYRRIAYRQAGNASFALLIAVIVAVPFSVSVLRAPEVSALTYHIAHLPEALPGSILDTVSGLFWHGDVNPVHNLPGRPLFGPVSAVAFILGAATLARRRRRPAYAAAAMMLAASLLPDALSAGGTDFTRLSVAMPAIYMTMSVGAAGAVRYLTHPKRWGGPAVSPRMVGLAAAGLFVVGVFSTARDLNTVWANREDVYTAYHGNLGRLAPHLDATARDLPTSICSPSLKLPDVLSDRHILNYMLHQPDLPLRYADCNTSLVLAAGGARQQIAFTYPEGPAMLPAALSAWFNAAHALEVTGLPPRSVFLLDVETRLHDAVGRFLTMAPAGFGPASPGGVGPAALPVRFGGNLTFEGYEVGQEAYRPGETVEVVTYWRVDGETPDEVQIFVHLLSDPGSPTPVSQSDRLGPLLDTLCPADIFVQYSSFSLPQQMLGGAYDLSMGVYRASNGIRLPVLDEGQPRGDRLFLSQVVVADE